MIDKKSATVVMFIVSFLMIILAVKEFFSFRDQIYQEAYSVALGNNVNE